MTPDPSYLGLAVENVLGRGLLEPGVPHKADAVGIRGRVRVLVVAGDEQLGEDGAPIHTGDDAIPGPSLVVEESVERDVGSGFVLESLGVVPGPGVVDEHVDVLVDGTLHKSGNPEASCNVQVILLAKHIFCLLHYC